MHRLKHHPCRDARTAFAALLLGAALAAPALPALAQEIQRFAIRETRVGTAAPARVTSLTADLTGPAPRGWSGTVENLVIEARPTPGSTTTFGVGDGSQCSHTPENTPPQVEFHNAAGAHSRGQPIARACFAWTAGKCSRTVTFMSRSFTANAGYPPCAPPGDPDKPEDGPPQQAADVPSTYIPGTPGTFTPGDAFTPIARKPSAGMFTVRIWGNFCYGARSHIFCHSLKTVPEGILASDVAKHTGYAATFAPGPNCGPARWPTPAWQAAGVPAHAEWCDVVVDMRRP